MGSLKKIQPISPAVWPAINFFFFKENRWGCSWPQAIPPISTPPNDTHVNHAWGSLVSPLKACTIAEPWMQAYPGEGLPEPVVFCSPRPTFNLVCSLVQ